MDTSKLKKFAQSARRSLMEQVSSKLTRALDDASAARRESPKAVKQLEDAIGQIGKERITGPKLPKRSQP